jgi:hypothetical protein
MEPWFDSVMHSRPWCFALLWCGCSNLRLDFLNIRAVWTSETFVSPALSIHHDSMIQYPVFMYLSIDSTGNYRFSGLQCSYDMLLTTHGCLSRLPRHVDRVEYSLGRPRENLGLVYYVVVISCMPKNGQELVVSTEYGCTMIGLDPWNRIHRVVGDRYLWGSSRSRYMYPHR